MKLSVDTAEAFANSILAKVSTARASGETTVDIELSARDAAVNALDEAQSLIDAARSTDAQSN